MRIDFSGGDPRFIHAGRRDGLPGLVELPDGQAAEFRAMARAALKCPVPGCPSPEITTVGGTGRRHHYRHLVKNAETDHGPETYFHLESKAVVEAWLRERCPGASVQLEKVLASGERIADVFAQLPTGEQYAVEVQFSSLSVETYRERHQWYESAGIVDIWLFIHRGVHLRTEWDDTVTVLLSPTHEAVADSGRRVLCINPALRMIGYGQRTQHAGNRAWTVHAESTGTFVTEPLDSFHLDPRIGMTTPTLDRMDADSDAAARAVEAERQRAEAAQQERRRQVAAAAARRSEYEKARRDAAVERARARDTFLAEWSSTPAAAAARSVFPAGPPSWIDDAGGLDVIVPARCWRWHLYSTHVASKRDGQYVTHQLLARELSTQFPGVFSSIEASQAAHQFLSALARVGLAHPSLERVGWWQVWLSQKIASPDASVADVDLKRVGDGEHLCEICGKPMDRNLPNMRAHFVNCELQLARRLRTPRRSD